MTAQLPGPGPIVDVEVGMRVVDRDGEEIGEVRTLKLGDPQAVTEQGQRAESGDLVSTVVELATGAEPAVPDEFARRLLRAGYIRIDTKGLFASDLYASADQIRGADDHGVHLTASRAELVPRS